jgi:hypothetical protein
MLSKYRVTWRHNTDGRKIDTFPQEKIYRIDIERQFNVKFHLGIEIMA